MFYTETQGIMINCLVSVVGVVLIVAFIYLTQKDTCITYRAIGKYFWCIFAVQFLSVAIAITTNILIGLTLDAMGLALSWFSNLWILFGLYFCPVFFVLGIGQSVLSSLRFMKNQNLPLNTATQMMMHSHSLFLIIVLIFMTSLGIRSSFVVMISLFFYIISVLINLVISRIYNHSKFFLI